MTDSDKIANSLHAKARPAFWKLSMGPASTERFKSVLHVLDLIRRGVVLVNKQTPAMGKKEKSQADLFLEHDRDGDYFYLCNGNKKPSVILLGQFVGPPNCFCERGRGWIERNFRWIKTATSTKSFKGKKKWWTPNYNSTFVQVGDAELSLFERQILKPYFDLTLSHFGIEEKRVY